ncbi:unnamed protein product [Cuscuta epithymum]|uniref:Uncharacterized protein n=1 Tax=Cuscuta epithymum TaxID=186058 RepID=A0AAV0E1M3_9ASTE|nr:unnamed protein product [Cuscuta epithymum]
MGFRQPHHRQKLLFNDNTQYSVETTGNPNQELWNHHSHTRLLSGRGTRKGSLPSKPGISLNQYYEPQISNTTRQRPNRRIWSPEYPANYYTLEPVYWNGTRAYLHNFWSPEYHTRQHPLRRSRTPAYHTRAYTNDLWNPPARPEARKNSIWDRGYAHQRQLVRHPNHHPPIQTKKSEDGWRLVKYRGRRNPKYPPQTLQAPSQPDSKNKRGTGSANRYRSLRIEDENPYAQSSESEVESDSTPSIFDSQTFRGISNIINERRTKSEGRNLSVADRGGQRRRPENSSVPPFCSTTGLAAIKPATDNLSADNIQSTGKSKLTWADVLKGAKDKMDKTDGPEIVSNKGPLSIAISSSQLAGILQSVDRASTSGLEKICSKELATTYVNDEFTDDLLNESQKYSFFGESGFDSVKIGNTSFKFAVRDTDLVLFQLKKSILHKIHIKIDLVSEIIGFISQIANTVPKNFGTKKRFEDITISVKISRAGSYVRMEKYKGSFIQIPMGHHNSSLYIFLNILTNFVGISKTVPDDSISLLHGNEQQTEDPTSISKLIFNYQIQTGDTKNTHAINFGKQPELPLIQAYSDASDDFDYSDDSLFTDDFLGHATESDRRPPISYPEEIRKSKFNTAICHKANFITSENCLPTENLNTQLKIYRKSQKNKRRHSMKTRSQTRDFPWD